MFCNSQTVPIQIKNLALVQVPCIPQYNHGIPQSACPASNHLFEVNRILVIEVTNQLEHLVGLLAVQNSISVISKISRSHSSGLVLCWPYCASEHLRYMQQLDKIVHRDKADVVAGKKEGRFLHKDLETLDKTKSK